jgi:exonuclease V
MALKSYTNMIAPLSETLELAYVHQSTRHTIGIDSFTYDKAVLNAHTESATAFFRGDREAVGVCVEEAWKCQSCQFLPSCAWRANAIQAPLRSLRYNLAFFD